MVIELASHFIILLCASVEIWKMALNELEFFFLQNKLTPFWIGERDNYSSSNS